MTDIVAPTPIADPPPAPLVTDTPADFNSKAFTLAGWYQTLVTALNGLIANVFNNATAAQERATSAGTSATTALGYRDQAGTYRDQAQAAAATAVNAPGTSGTSATSLAVTVGTKTLTTQTGKAWAAGQPVVISRTAAPTTVQMYGVIASYDAGTGAMSVTVSADGLQGSGTYTDWTIALTGMKGPTGLAFVAVTGISYTAQAGQAPALRNAGLSTVTLPASPADGARVTVYIENGRYDNAVARNGQLIMGLAEDMVLDDPDASWPLIFSSVSGWRLA